MDLIVKLLKELKKLDDKQVRVCACVRERERERERERVN